MSENLIEFNNFSFVYGQTKILDYVSFNINKGDFALLSGSTGSGKTTLLKSILGSGYVNGNAEGTLSIKTKNVGYVSQEIDSQLVCDSVWHEIAFSLENRGFTQSLMRKRVAEVCSFFNIETWFRKEICELSGGQKQLVNVCRALAPAPDVLLLDEPTSELDFVAEKNFLHALFRLNRELGITIVVATHSPHVMSEYANRAFKIVDKKVIELNISDYREKAELKIAVPRHDAGIENKQAVKFIDAYVRYGTNNNYVLRSMDCEFLSGTINAIIGGNGAGKTTTLLSIAKILKTNRGRIINEYFQNQAFLPQQPTSLFVADSVIEELKEWQMSAGYTEDDIMDILDYIGMSDKLNIHPYDLSGGQKQLLAFAKILLTKPKLLLCDEPTKGLDSRLKLKVANLIKLQKQRGSTIIIATHDFEFAYLVCDFIIQIFDGQVSSSARSVDFFKDNLFLNPQKSEFFELFKEAYL